MSFSHIIKRALLLLSLPILLAVWIAANYYGKQNPLQAVDINILENPDGNFVDEKEILTTLITNRNIVVGSTRIKYIDLKQLEQVAKNNPWVDRVDAYINNSGILKINIVQKKAVLRLIAANGAHYYLDSTASIIPLNEFHSINTPVLSISNSADMSLENQNLKKQAVALAQFIAKDSFWNAMISQISIANESDFELTSNIAEHSIIFGDTSNMHDKFNRLLLFYKEAAPKVGYDAYSNINVKNIGQIVGTKRTKTLGDGTVVADNSPYQPSWTYADNIAAPSTNNTVMAVSAAASIVKPAIIKKNYGTVNTNNATSTNSVNTKSNKKPNNTTDSKANKPNASAKETVTKKIAPKSVNTDKKNASTLNKTDNTNSKSKPSVNNKKTTKDKVKTEPQKPNQIKNNNKPKEANNKSAKNKNTNTSTNNIIPKPKNK